MTWAFAIDNETAGKTKTNISSNNIPRCSGWCPHPLLACHASSWKPSASTNAAMRVFTTYKNQVVRMPCMTSVTLREKELLV
jgi:hypothetical protein